MHPEEFDYLKRFNISEEAINHFSEIMNYERGFQHCIICKREAMNFDYIEGKFIYYCEKHYNEHKKLLYEIKITKNN